VIEAVKLRPFVMLEIGVAADWIEKAGGKRDVHPFK
jgi:hypothetical protein